VASNTNDSGWESLRARIAASNVTAGAYEIIFAIPGSGSHTIQPQRALPAITNILAIDEYTQYGATPAIPLSPAVLKIEPVGSSAIRLDIVTSICLIRNLCISGILFVGIGA